MAFAGSSPVSVLTIKENIMHPKPKHGGTPKAARFFVERWFQQLDGLDFEYIHTPKGAILISRNKKKKIYEIRNPVNDNWFTVSHGLEDLKQALAETIAICFGWRKKNGN